MRTILSLLAVSIIFISCENGTAAQGQKDTLTNANSEDLKEQKLVPPAKTGADTTQMDSSKTKKPTTGM